MLTKKALCAFAFASILLTATSPQAEVAGASTSFPIQGLLVDSSGSALDGENAFVFTLYGSCEADADALGEPFSQTLTVNEGVFSTSIQLTNSQISSIQGSTELCLGITVNADEEMTPRIPYYATPWALYSNRSEVATTALSLAAGATGNLASTLTGSGLR